MAFASFPFSVTVPLAAFGEQRARGGALNVRPYTPAETLAVRRCVADHALRQVGQLVLPGPLQVAIVAGFKRPKRQRTALPVVKPDFDNIAKVICDALKGILWTDDAVISDGHVYKRYMENPRMILIVRSDAPDVLPYMEY